MFSIIKYKFDKNKHVKLDKVLDEVFVTFEEADTYLKNLSKELNPDDSLPMPWPEGYIISETDNVFLLRNGYGSE